MTSSTSNTILKALVASKDGERDYSETLRAALDADGVTDEARMAAVVEMLESAREILSCTSFDEAADKAEFVACALDQQFEAATTLAELLQEFAAMRER